MSTPVDAPSFDVVVVGAGPAGLAAATEVARAGLKALCLDKLAPGGALINLTALHDYKEGADGPQVASQLTDDATAAGVEIGFGEVVRLSGSGPWTVETAEGEHHAGRAVVIATGLGKGRLGLPGEDHYEGRGLSHCASCDGPLYAGLPVIVAGSAGWAPHEARELQAFASEVTVIDTVAAKLPDGVRHLDGRIVALEGSEGLQSVVVESGGGRKTVPTSAVFVYVTPRLHPAEGVGRQLPRTGLQTGANHAAIRAQTVETTQPMFPGATNGSAGAEPSGAERRATRSGPPSSLQSPDGEWQPPGGSGFDPGSKATGTVASRHLQRPIGLRRFRR
jgi:thioredoxin reductase (NADPH)